MKGLGSSCLVFSAMTQHREVLAQLGYLYHLPCERIPVKFNRLSALPRININFVCLVRSNILEPKQFPILHGRGIQIHDHRKELLEASQWHMFVLNDVCKRFSSTSEVDLAWASVVNTLGHWRTLEKCSAEGWGIENWLFSQLPVACRELNCFSTSISLLCRYIWWIILG